VELHDRFPDKCRFVIESFRVIYHNEKIARDAGMSAEARLELHQTQSGPTMDKLQTWLRSQFSQKQVEPNAASAGQITILVQIVTVPEVMSVGETAVRNG
jgi:hypothetical protein